MTLACNCDVTVVIPSYNGRKWIEQAVRSCLIQADVGFRCDVIVVDDASTDDACDVVSSIDGPVKLLRIPVNSGRHVARNHGLAAATGTFVKFLDQDDYLEPTTLKVEFERGTESGADIVIAGHRIVRVERDGSETMMEERVSPPLMEPRIPSILNGNAVPTAAALYRRAYIERLEWDGDVPRLDDWDFFVRAALQMGNIVACEHVSYAWRQHHDQYTHTSTLHRYAVDHHAVLHKLEQWLIEHNEFNELHRSRLAQYYYKMLRAIYIYDRDWYDKALNHIYELDPHFFPHCEPRKDVQRLCSVVGVRTGLTIYNRVADGVRRIRSMSGAK